MSFIACFALTLLITLADLLSAWMYVSDNSPDHLGIMLLRYSREGLMVLMMLWGLRDAYRTGGVFICACLYASALVAYGLIGTDDSDVSLMIASAAKLALPVMLVAVGYGVLRTAPFLRWYALILAGLGIASTIFGAWDIRHTEFWTETIQYGHYLSGIKGIVAGFDSYYVLPFNFFGYEKERRAAGLVAAPLAQGSFVAIAAVLGFAALHRRSFAWALVVLVLGVFGVWQSGTRGAMLILLIALPIFLLGSGRGGALLRNVTVLLGLLGGAYEALRFVYSYSVNLDDGSTIGHVDALQKNLTELPQVILFGPGLGASGSVAADMGLEIAGGGEGAFFAIAYQMGLPIALVFVAFYGFLLQKAWKLSRTQHPSADLALAGCALGVGFITTFISSDHVFSLSGMGVFWIVLGGILFQAVQAQEHSA